VLVLRALGLGDLLTAVPALRGVRRALPDHRLRLATDPALRDLVALIDAVDSLLPARGLEPLAYERPPPAVAVNLHGRGPQSHRLLEAVSPRRTVAFGCADAGVPGPRWCRDEHEVTRWCRLVDQTLGPVCDPSDLGLPAPRHPDARAPGVVVHPGAAKGARRWPVERFAAVAARLAGQGHRVWLTGSRTERPLAERVAALAGLDPDTVLAGATSLTELAALVSGSSLVLCGDTGTAHLATAFGTPSVVLFGPTPPAWWGPPAHGPHIVLWHGTEPGDPWAQTPDPALLQISVAEVTTAVEGLLASVRRRRRWPRGPR
jgi:ADP-heptose:LPS heptosyltransferase